MFAIRPALTSMMDAIRRSAVNSIQNAEPKVRRFEQPVPKVVRLPRHRDGFEGAAGFRQSSSGSQAGPNSKANENARSATAQPRGGATDVTRFLRHDGFETATRKPVELSPKPPPSFKPAVAVFRFR